MVAEARAAVGAGETDPVWVAIDSRALGWACILHLGSAVVHLVDAELARRFAESTGASGATHDRDAVSLANLCRSEQHRPAAWKPDEAEMVHVETPRQGPAGDPAGVHAAPSILVALVPLLTPLMVILLLVLILMPDAGPRDASLVFVLAVPLAPLLVGAAYDTVRRIVRVDLWLAGEQLVLRTQTQLRARERRIPLVDLKGARVVGTTVVLDVAGEAVEVPVPDRTPQTREELVAFLQVQIARSADRRGEVPDDLVRLRQATARVPERG